MPDDFAFRVPAVKDNNTGKVHVGKRGDWHLKILEDHHLSMYEHDTGFVDPKSGKYYTQNRLPLDAGELDA